VKFQGDTPFKLKDKFAGLPGQITWLPDILKEGTGLTVNTAEPNGVPVQVVLSAESV
jgi:hypothetical protein